MSDAQLRTDLQAIFHDVFDDPGLTIHDSMTAHDVEEWDSLTHINLIVAAEKHFKVRFSTKEVSSLANVGEFIQLIHSKLDAKPA